MNCAYENIQFNSSIPIKIFIHNLNYTENHWHDALEILLVLEGSISIGIGNSIYRLDDEGLIVINPNEIHTTSATGSNLVLALQIPTEWIRKFTPFGSTRLSCVSSTSGNQTQLTEVRKLLARMMWTFNNRSRGYELRVQSCLYELLYRLFTCFGQENSDQASRESERFIERLSGIIGYLHENYRKDVTLQSLAQKEFLSVSYLSRFFKRQTGVSFKEYIVQIRLEHAVEDLLYTDKSILRLSLDNGFPNTKSFLAAFKETYHEAPSLYRKKAKEDSRFLYGPRQQSGNYLEMTNFDMFKSLYKYLNSEEEQFLQDTSGGSAGAGIELGEADLRREGTPLAHTWKKLLTVGRASDVLKASIQEKLTGIRKEIGFEALRFHGIFDDDMDVYREDANGNPIFNFSRVDQLVDFLRKVGLRPFFELGFMPSMLARDPENTVFYRPSIISMPKDMSKWLDLVRQFILHCISRYGMGEVLTWNFEFWNEPELAGFFWRDSEDEYLAFYEMTYRTVKSISEDISIGGPAVCFETNIYEWLERFFAFCKTRGCLPDFFSFHSYLHTASIKEVTDNILSGNGGVRLTNDSDYLKHTVGKLKEIVSRYGYDSSRIFMTEWNASPSHRDLCHDTAYMASFIAKNICENMDSISSFGFWTASDLIEENPLPPETFHGGMGLITVSGLRKAGYYAFWMLNRMGSVKVAEGPGYYVTSDERGYQMLLYNYCHFDPLYCSMDHSGITPLSRYNVFMDSVHKMVQITLKGIEASRYSIREYIVNRTHGSAFDEWVEMGAPENMDTEEITYLNKKSVPFYQKKTEMLQGDYAVRRSLAPHEVRLIIIEKSAD